MMMFHAAPRAEEGTREPSAHERINQVVASLHVVCTGQENGRLYFEKLDGAPADNEHLVQQIVHALVNTPELRSGLGSVNTISLKA